MRRNGLSGMVLLSYILVLCLGCLSDSGWEPVAGIDANAMFLNVPVLNRDETHTVVLRVFNNGSETIPGGFELTLEVFEDASYTVPYGSLITVIHPTDITSGQTVNVTFLLPIDIATAIDTTLYLVATADSLDTVTEAIETNNVLETSRVVALERRADLIVENVELPDYMLQGSSYTVTVTVRNIDDKAATAPFFVEVAEPSVPWLDTLQVNTDLAPGDSVDVSTTYTVGVAAALGDRTFTATADTTAVVDERDEGNNALANISPVATMDFILQITAFDPNYVVGVQYNATIRITNNSSITSPATSVSIYIMDPITLAVLRTRPGFAVPAIAPGGFVDTDSVVVIPTGSAVDRWLVYEVDSADLIEENDEGNNLSIITLLPM